MSNGCGCQSTVLKYIRPPYAGIFRAACEVHDDDYENGTISRSEADRMLFRRMVRIASSYHPVKATWLVGISLLYWLAVRTFGSFFYKGQ